MNRLISERVRREPRELGLIDRGIGQLTDDRRDDLQRAMVDYETAARAGDDVGRDMADARLDRILSEVRSAREPAKPPPTSFDGGVRGVRPKPTRRSAVSANDLMREVMVTSRIERLNRERA